MSTTAPSPTEDVEHFRQRARDLDPGQPAPARPRAPRWACCATIAPTRRSSAAVARDRQVQRKLFDAGLAGICFPTEYGGQGLTPAHQRALNEELAGYEYPTRIQVPTFSPVRRRPARVRHRGAEAAPHARHPEGRGDVDAVPVRAERRIGRGRGAHHRRARRRRVGAQRLEDLDHRRVVVRLGAVPGPYQLGRAQAPRPDGLHPAHPPARRSRSTASRCSTAPRSSARSS